MEVQILGETYLMDNIEHVVFIVLHADGFLHYFAPSRVRQVTVQNLKLVLRLVIPDRTAEACTLSCCPER